LSLVRTNIQRVKLSEGEPGLDSESYVHIRVQPAKAPSLLSRYWKQSVIVSLTVALFFQLTSHPSIKELTKADESSISLAALAELQEEELMNVEASRLEESTTAVVYSGSEYQARIEREFENTQVPLVQGSEANSQLIPAGKGLIRRHAKFTARPEHREDLRSMVKFISGLIAVNRPNIADCGTVAAAIVRIAAKEKVDPFLVAAIISVESRFGNTERSSVGAVGLMQLMPATARGVADPKLNIKPSLTDINTNIQLGIDYWKELMRRYKGNTFLALSAYNWGPGNVDRNGRNPAKVPGSVAKYARTIIERHKSWVNHYQNAKAGASELG